MINKFGLRENVTAAEYCEGTETCLRKEIPTLLVLIRLSLSRHNP